VIRNADWILDLGPEGGEDGGRVVAEGRPVKIAATNGSYTGEFLARYYTAANGKRAIDSHLEPAQNIDFHSERAKRKEVEGPAVPPRSPHFPLVSAEIVGNNDAGPASIQPKPSKHIAAKKSTTRKKTDRP
jgi:excinuclease ABC subunit A